MGANIKERLLPHAVPKEDRPLLYLLPSDHRCRRFRYDPLRRIPGRPAAPKHTHDDADFSL